jgi:predicted RNase H-like nuclease
MFLGLRHREAQNHKLMARLTQISGVDGCKNGRWIAVTTHPGSFDKAEVKIFESTVQLISKLATQSIIAIDIPIGLPERAIRGGRGPDWAVREFLRPHQARVFPVPSRRAVYALAQGYAQVCAIARETSDPPRSPSKQLFGILPRIQEIDVVLRQDPALRERIFEVHPECSFKLMNNNDQLPPKKVKGRIHPPGIELRMHLLAKVGFSPSFLSQTPPRGSELDDFYDACACAWSARRILDREARLFPLHPPLDGEGIEQAIRA